MAVSKLLPSIMLLLTLQGYHVGPRCRPLPLRLLPPTPNGSFSFAPFSWLHTEDRCFCYNTSRVRSLFCSQPWHSPQRRDHSHNKWPAGSYVICPTFSPIVVLWPRLLFSPWSLHSTLSALLPASQDALFLCSFSPLCVFLGTCRLELVPSPSWPWKDSSSVYSGCPIQAAAPVTVRSGTLQLPSRLFFFTALNTIQHAIMFTSILCFTFCLLQQEDPRGMKASALVCFFLLRVAHSWVLVPRMRSDAMRRLINICLKNVWKCSCGTYACHRSSASMMSFKDLPSRKILTGGLLYARP